MLISAVNSWLSQAGDTGIIAWVTVAIYFIAAYLSANYGRGLTSIPLIDRNPHEHKFWYVISILLVFLAINKQLDLQTLITAVGKEVAEKNNWYEVRRTYQSWFILTILFSSSGLLAVSLYILRDTLKKNFLALTGLFLLVLFIQIRAISFHHIDRMLNFDIAGYTLHWLLEIGGLALIIFSIYKQKYGHR